MKMKDDAILDAMMKLAKATKHETNILQYVHRAHPDDAELHKVIFKATHSLRDATLSTLKAFNLGKEEN